MFWVPSLRNKAYRTADQESTVNKELLKSAHRRQVHDVIRLLEQNARATYDRYGENVLHKACRSHVDEVSKLTLLLDRFVSVVNDGSHQGYTPLHFAVARDSVPLTKCLLSHPDVDVNCQCMRGRTPLHVATRYNHKDVFQLLLASPHLQVNLQDCHGNTAAHNAAKKRHVELFIALVLHRDYRIEIENDRYETANSIYHARCLQLFQMRYWSSSQNANLNTTHNPGVIEMDVESYDGGDLDSLRRRHRLGGNALRPRVPVCSEESLLNTGDSVIKVCSVHFSDIVNCNRSSNIQSVGVEHQTPFPHDGMSAEYLCAMTIENDVDAEIQLDHPEPTANKVANDGFVLVEDDDASLRVVDLDSSPNVIDVSSLNDNSFGQEDLDSSTDASIVSVPDDSSAESKHSSLSDSSSDELPILPFPQRRFGGFPIYTVSDHENADDATRRLNSDDIERLLNSVALTCPHEDGFCRERQNFARCLEIMPREVLLAWIDKEERCIEQMNLIKSRPIIMVDTECDQESKYQDARSNAATVNDDGLEMKGSIDSDTLKDDAVDHMMMSNVLPHETFGVPSTNRKHSRRCCVIA